MKIGCDEIFWMSQNLSKKLIFFRAMRYARDHIYNNF